MDTLEQRIRYTRKKILAMTQEEFADTLGVSRDVISRYETGKTKLPAKQALKVTELAHISVDWLLSGRGDMPMQRKETQIAPEDLASRINKLEEDFKLIKSFILKK